MGSTKVGPYPSHCALLAISWWIRLINTIPNNILVLININSLIYSLKRMGVTSDTEAYMSSLTDVGGDDVPPLKNNSASSLATEGSVFKKESLGQSLNCPHCNYRAKQYMNLHRHLLLHQIKSNYSCPLCSYSALRVGGITRHLNRHHPENDDTENETALPKSTIQVYTYGISVFIKICQ